VALGVPLGGLIGNHDPLLPLRVGAGVLVAAAGLALVVVSPTQLGRTQRSLAALVRSVLTDRALAVPFAYAFCDRFTVGFFTTTFPLYLKRTFDLEPAQIGKLLALFLVPFSLLSFPLGKVSERRSHTVLVAGGSAIYGAAVCSLTAWPEHALPVLMLVLGISSAVMYVPSMLLVSDLVSPEAKSTALGGFNAAGSLGFILGPLVGGTVSQLVAARADWDAGYTAAFVVAGASEIACVAITLPLLLRLRRAGRTT
jgi:MFS family permease